MISALIPHAKTPKKERRNFVNNEFTYKSLYKTLAISLAVLAICVACLAYVSSTWSTLDLQGSKNIISDAEFSASVSVSTSKSSQIDYKKAVLAPDSYEVIIEQTGNAESGYCLVTIDGTTYFAGKLAKGNNGKATQALKFNLAVVNESALVSIEPAWGEYRGDYPNLPSSVVGRYDLSETTKQATVETADETNFE